MQKGEAISFDRDVRPWYSGYGTNPSVVIPAGHPWRVQSVDVPAVRGRNGNTYNVAECDYNGQRWQTAF